MLGPTHTNAGLGRDFIQFLGLGAQKAGTTWLYAMMKGHPGIYLPDTKEMHFWDLQPVMSPQQYRQQFAAARPGTVKGEITPSYAAAPVERIREAHDVLPSAKLIYSLRNPIERAWSAAIMALVFSDLSIEEASDQWFIDHFKSKGSLLSGDYEKCIKNWLSVYPENSMLVLYTDDISSHPLSVLFKVSDHLGVSRDPFRAFPPEQLKERIWTGPGLELRASLRAVLQEMYLPKIQSLSKFLGKDLSHWR